MSNIKEALEKLDHQNDDHWTSGGSPKVSAVQELAGDLTITRKQIVAADPNLTRIDITENKGETKEEEKEEVVELTDDELVEKSVDEVLAMDRDTQWRYVDLQQAEVDGFNQVKKQADDDLMKALRKMTPVRDHLEYQTPEDKAEQDSKNLHSWLNAMTEQRQEKTNFIKSLNLPKRKEMQALATKGSKGQKLAKVLK